jgi:L-cysteine/cystine lyase
MLDINQHRQEFTGLNNKYYFNFGGQGTLPKSALQKIIDIYQYIEEIGPFGLKVNSWLQSETLNIKKVIANEVGATPETITLTENVTTGCNIPLWGIEWQENEEILLTDAEHPSIIATVKEIARRFGVKIRTCPILDTLNQGNPVALIKNHLTPQTRLVIISHILWNTGQLLPLKEIVSICHNYSAVDKQILVLVDAAQSAGSLPLNLPESGVDFYGCTGHKWFCGPSGVGFLYVRPELFKTLHPTYIGWRGLVLGNQGEVIDFKEDGSRYEVATSAYPLFFGFQEAILVHHQWGNSPQRYQRICELSNKLWSQLTEIDGIECLKQTPPQSGLVSFYVKKSLNSRQLVKKLEEKSFLLRTLAYPDCVRACVHYFTLESEVDALVDAIKSCL